MGELINIGSIMGKELLNLADGTMLGKVCGVVLTPDCKVAGLKVRERKLMGSTITVAFENVKSFGATITLHGVSNVLAAETRTVLGKNVITADGNLLGRVEELAFDMETGVVEEIVIQGELMDTMLGGRGILPGAKLLSFGKDVVIAADNITAEDFQQPEEGFYGDWKAMDEVLNEIDGEAAEFEEAAANGEAEKASRVENTIDGLTKTLEETIQKLKDEVTSDRVKEQTDRLIDRVGEETKNIFNELRLMVKNIDAEAIKSKINRKETPEDVLAADLEAQLQGLTVEKPVLDSDGNVIAWPGQVLDKEKIKLALRVGALQELLDYATVNLEAATADGEADANEGTDAVEVVMDDAPEIEVEIIVDDILEVAETAEDIVVEETAAEEAMSEEDAFIAEEAAKMEAAEQA
ncbi:MAG: PRC-barrel domain-containing protein [Peptococcaceae bacterium]|nr:PRC-barrel domain-containing protein [Peptococcaceae bacterium]MBP3341230.1 PRC-barrel domain-containing protein [Peptococcaceae bacterium]MBP3626134.1 PRC-barrel domain-containing protein [Peptococcaceae bacterium]